MKKDPMLAAEKLLSAPRCGARTRKGGLCQQPAMANGRCRLHGGKSTGPRTREGLDKCKKAPWKHGLYSAEALAERKRFRQIMEGLRKTLKDAESSA